MPGAANFWSRPTREKLCAAVACLAGWHRAAADFEPRGDERVWFSSGVTAPSPAVAERYQAIQSWQQGRCQRLRRLIECGDSSELGRLGLRILGDFERAAPIVVEELRSLLDVAYRLQPCLRDVWHDHVLFTGDAVTGLIDASACRSENTSADLARLLGSLVGDDRAAWHAAIDEYGKHRDLIPQEFRLLGAMDRSAVLLSGMTWLDRHYLQTSPRGDPNRIIPRLQAIADRLQHLAAVS